MRNKLIGVFCFFTLLALLVTGCANPAVEGSATPAIEESLESNSAWLQYRSTMVKASGDSFLVEGDLLFSSEEEIKEYFISLTGLEAGRSTVHLHKGNRDVWSAAQKRNLTYSVNGFGVNQAEVTSLMTRATLQWESAADIDFKDIGASTSKPLFIVRAATAAEEKSNPYTIASAFFPSLFARELVLYKRFFAKDDAGRMSTMVHELGHILGLRHEHIWKNGKQVEESSYPAELITALDKGSIMHYNWKPGYNGNGKLTALDKRGVKILYGGKRGVVALHRYWNSGNTDHFYTTSWNEIAHGKYGYKLEGVQGFVYSNKVNGSVPLYRYWNSGSGNHFYTTSWAELGNGGKGYKYEGIECYVFPNKIAGTVALYRYFNGGSGDHFYTTSWSELGNGGKGYRYEGIQCYILP